MKSILIANARVVNEGKTQSADLFIDNGRIEKIAPSLTGQPADIIIDAAGRTLLPGMIDCHVHCREPGMEAKGDLHSETRAAVAGGVTSIMDMPNTRPATTSGATLADKFKRAAGRCAANYSFYIGATNDNLEELLQVDRTTVCGVKLFMGASTGNLLVDRVQALESIFGQVDLPIAVHCEDTGTIQKNEREMRERFGPEIPFRYHPLIRSEEACYRSTAQAVELARRHGTQLHVLHLTTARELELFASGPAADKRITAEACPHHLWFSVGDYDELGARIKCNPAIKTADDRAALRQALLDDIVDTVGTDHAPHLLEEKQKPYAQAPSGMPSIQSALAVLLEFLPPETVAEKCAHNPARIFQIQERGFIREGYWADLVLVDTETPHTVRRENIEYKCGWSPFEGATFRTSIAATIVSGHLAFLDGQLHDTPRGQPLHFNR